MRRRKERGDVEYILISLFNSIGIRPRQKSLVTIGKRSRKSLHNTCRPHLLLCYCETFGKKSGIIQNLWQNLCTGRRDIWMSQRWLKYWMEQCGG